MDSLKKLTDSSLLQPHNKSVGSGSRVWCVFHSRLVRRIVMFKYVSMLLVSAFIISAVAPVFISDARADDRKGYDFKDE